MNKFLELSVLAPEQWSPRDASEVISWHGHIPFAFSLIRILKPACVVELGTHKGDSYLAFCEAVERHSPATRCFAIDSWKGDSQAGYYGDEIFQLLKAKHDPQYGRFSKLIQSTFDDALLQFEDGSIDLLHIDGLHTYDAVRHDFETWKSKLSDSAVVLFHDITVQQESFGVGQFWQEICEQYSSFEFRHSNGLGVLAVGQNAAKVLPDLFRITPKTADQIRTLYSVVGNSVAFRGLYKLLLLERQRAEAEIERLGELIQEERLLSGAERSRLTDLVAEREGELVHLDHERTRLTELVEQDLRAADTEMMELQSEVTELNERYVQFDERNNHELALLTEQLEEDRQVADAEILRLRGEVSEYKERYAQLDEQGKQERVRLTEQLEEDRQVADAEMLRLRGEVSEYKERYAQLDEQGKQERVRLTEQLEEDRQVADAEMLRLRGEVSEYKERYAQLDEQGKQERVRLTERLEEDRQVAGAEMLRLRGEVSEYKERYAQLDEQSNQERARFTELIAEDRRVVGTEIARLSNVITERENQYLSLKQEINELISSTSWKVTYPIRFTGTIFRFVIQLPKKFLILLLRKIYHHLPIGVVDRNRLKGRLYRRFPTYFSHTLSYSLWKSQTPGEVPQKIEFADPQKVGDPFEIQVPEHPVVSIVIPVYGKVEYTYKCLRSLWSHRSNYSFELIVVDDCSPDNTLEVLDTIKGVRVVPNETNSGFIRSCNHGAQHARGKLLVMLNNDTIVRPEWLNELVNTFNCIPKAGLVGSKLIYPDGRLQEAGGIIWRDGSGWNYGRLQDPNRPEYSYLRDADYCSGASLMITKVLYDQLGGFDEHYLPAYGEDSDLAFRVRQAGYRVLYQPLSHLVHSEGITSGKEVSSGIKAYQVENAKKLYARWQSVLAEHGEPGVKPECEKDRGVSGRVLVLDHCTPTPDQDAGSITAVNIIRLMQGLGFKVTFVPEDNFLYMDSYTSDLQRMGVECLYLPYVTSVEQHLAESGEQYDVVVVFRLLAAERNLAAIRKYCPNAKLVFHTADLHYLRELREAELMSSDEMRLKAKKTKQRELDLIRAVDATIVHSSTEKELLDAELEPSTDKSNIYLFSWAIEIPGTEVPFDPRKDMVFIGGFQHQPNVDAVIYFASEIFPLIKEKLPDAVFRIVGSRATPEVLSLAGDGIEVLGFVEDLKSVLDRSRISVVPLRYGAGIKGKIGTSLSFGLPCVTTTIGAEGMGLSQHDGVLVKDDPAGFADTVVSLYQDAELWLSCSRGGLDFVKRNYSLEAGMMTVHSLLTEIGVPESKMVARGINHQPGAVEGVAITADQPHDPQVIECDIQSKAEFDKWSASAELKACRERELSIARTHSGTDNYHTPGYCRVCECEVEFLIDRQCGAIESDGIWVPNWRERLVCPYCSLNNRQRSMALAALNIVRGYRDRRPEVYLMEQVTAIFHWMTTSVLQANCTGSEYLGEDVPRGKVSKGIRHEDVERLSFADNSFDLIISNDVLEHVVNPRLALEEACRVLGPRGELLMTVPFYLGHAKSERRADLKNGKLEHLLPPIYHGNPVSDDGSLVFTDFGWEFLQDIRDAGFARAELHFYWSEVYGHLGAGQHYIHAEKG